MQERCDPRLSYAVDLVLPLPRLPCRVRVPKIPSTVGFRLLKLQEGFGERRGKGGSRVVEGPLSDERR